MKTAYEKVQAARAKGRPSGIGFIKGIFTDFIELHGDRRFAEDSAIVGGIARLRNRPVTVIAMEKGGNTKEKVFRNFGSPNPEGYRKALRLMRQAEKFHRPVICFVDTSGAFCGIGAEERGQGQAIAENLMEMMDFASLLSLCSSEKAAAAVHWRWLWAMKSGCWKMLFIRLFHRKDAPASCGKTQKKIKKQPNASNLRLRI